MEGHWTMRDGTQIRYVDMTPSHLRNAAKMLRRIVEKEIDSGWGMLSMTQGEHAADAIESQLNAMMDGYDPRSDLADQMDQLANEKDGK